jgi:DNA-binding NarL/FixJ family response regulator
LRRAVMNRNPCIAVVDEREFRRTGLMRLLEPWASVEKIRIVSFTPEQTEQWVREDFEFKMLIFGIGSELLFESKTLDTLEMLRSRYPNTPLVLISDREDDHDVAIAMSKGVQGYIFSGINSPLAFQALSFILRGGVYFPPSAFRNLQPVTKGAQNSPKKSVEGSESLPTTGDAMESIVPGNTEENIIWSNLTVRQRQVLEHIRLGESNKLIGRHLGMTEGTVKVHVRQIMRKAGAANRTQLAVGKGAHLKKVET